MVKSAIKISQSYKSGIVRLMRRDNINQKFAHIQGMWRFLNNDRVSIKELGLEMISKAQKSINVKSGNKVLILNDWSYVNYTGHKNKKRDLISENSGRGQKRYSYELQSSLAVDTISGEAIAPIVMNLKSKESFYSSYEYEDVVKQNKKHLDELLRRINIIENNYLNKIDKRGVYIVDREGDSVAFIEALIKKDFQFIIRGKSEVIVQYNEEYIKQKELLNFIDKGKRIIKGIKYKKDKIVDIYANETYVTVKRKYQRVATQAVKVKVVIERVIEQKTNKVVDYWILLTNIEDESSETIAKWYYYRWKIESFFKLLKSQGFNLEEWQQTTAKATFKRLIITAFAIIAVLHIANQKSKEAKELRDFLILLDGRYIQRGKEYTLPSLLGGLFILLRIFDTIENFSLEEIMKYKQTLNNLIGDIIKV